MFTIFSKNLKTSVVLRILENIIDKMKLYV